MKKTYPVKHIAGTIVFFAIIFLSAGHLFYWQGLTYVAIGLFMILMNYTFLRIDADLLKERENPGKDAIQWDKSILGLSFLATIGMYIVAGLDSGRFHWSPDFHPAFYIAGILLTMSGQLIFLIAQKQNRFFSSTVRIQKERNHTVCQTGLYKVVRHPAYMGSVVQSAGFPLLFGSVWSIFPVLMLIVLLIIRTAKEDSFLLQHLNGYREYSEKTPCRMIPYIW